MALLPGGGLRRARLVRARRDLCGRPGRRQGDPVPASCVGLADLGRPHTVAARRGRHHRGAGAGGSRRLRLSRQPEAARPQPGRVHRLDLLLGGHGDPVGAAREPLVPAQPVGFYLRPDQPLRSHPAGAEAAERRRVAGRVPVPGLRMPRADVRNVEPALVRGHRRSRVHVPDPRRHGAVRARRVARTVRGLHSAVRHRRPVRSGRGRARRSRPHHHRVPAAMGSRTAQARARGLGPRGVRDPDAEHARLRRRAGDACMAGLQHRARAGLASTRRVGLLLRAHGRALADDCRRSCSSSSRSCSW